MQARIRLKIKKSKLAFGVVNECTVTPIYSIDAKQQKGAEMTLRSERHSNRKFKTVNCKDSNTERGNVYDNVINRNHKPMSLYLDGGKHSSVFRTFQELIMRQKTPKKSNAHNFFQKPLAVGLVSQPKVKVDKKQVTSKKSLKVMILKQIQLKNKRKISQNNKLLIQGPQFQDVQQIFTLKKIERQHPLLNDPMKNKSFNRKQKFDVDLQNVNNNEMNMSQKFSVFSERSNIPKKIKKVIKNPQNKLSQVILPSVDKKHLTRPLITLDFNEAKRIQSQSYVVVKHPQGQVVSGKGYKKNGQIASLTKIMTFYTILKICQEHKVDYTRRMVEIIERAEGMSGTSAEILAGEKYTLEQLFYGMMLPSGNDAAMAIASEGGTILKENQSKVINQEDQNIKCFIKCMNFYAKSISMTTSSFTNPHGLSDPNNQSNPYQMSLLIGQCLKFQEFLKVSGTKCYNCWIEGSRGKREVIWQNTHKLLRRQGFIGGKTGVTVTAGPCLATIYKSSTSQHFITIALRSPKLSRRFKQTRWILGLTLKEYNKKYDSQARQILTQNPQLDSDNSQDEGRFDFNKSDQSQLRKRGEILAYQL